MHDELLASRPEGASHNQDICPFCVDKATEDESTASRIPPASGGPDVSDNHQIPNTEGGTTEPMSDSATISQETHEALLAKAVADATVTTEKALESATNDKAELAARVEGLESDNATLKADNDRLNGELDAAQVALKAANDRVAELESDIKAKDEAAAKSELASKRADQVKNLKLYDDEYVAERASAWADLSDDAWAARLDEWAKIKPSAGTPGTPAGDTASAMSGTSGSLTTEPSSTDTARETKSPARRAALGLS